jgi:hypothetical protein
MGIKHTSRAENCELGGEFDMVGGSFGKAALFGLLALVLLEATATPNKTAAQIVGNSSSSPGQSLNCSLN